MSYFFLIYIALFVKRPQYKPIIKIKPIIEITTSKIYFFDGDEESFTYMSPKPSITFTCKNNKNIYMACSVYGVSLINWTWSSINPFLG